MTRLVFVPVIMSCLVLGAASCDRTDDAMTGSAKSPSTAKGGAANGSSAFPDEWFFYAQKRPATLRGLEGKPATELTVKNWIGEPQKLSNLKGKIVVVDFWATWCGPCMMALPHNVEMADKYKDKGVVLIGIHNTERGSEKMAAVAQSKKLNYPLSVDDGGKSAKAYRVAFWPTYVLIDRKGIVRAAGLEPGSVEKAVEVLLNETS